MSDPSSSLTRADYLRQKHVALTVGFKVMDMVEVTGCIENPARGAQSGLGVVSGLGTVYSVHNKTKTASVAMACWLGKKSTCIGFPFMRHYAGKPTDELITTYRSVKKLQQQLGKWAPPTEGSDD